MFVVDCNRTREGAGKSSFNATRHAVRTLLLPVGQVRQFFDPRVGVNSLFSWLHFMQVGMPSAFANLPSSHLWHDMLALYELVPVGHNKQRSDGGSVPMVPDRHSSIPSSEILHPGATVTEEAPPVPTIVPGGGSRHSVPFWSSCIQPDGHFSHVRLARVLEYVPLKYLTKSRQYWKSINVSKVSQKV